MDIQAEARRMMQDDRYAWEMLGRFKSYFEGDKFPQGGQLQEAEQLRLV
jgi:hypothetical protein